MSNQKEVARRIANRIIPGVLLALALFIIGCSAPTSQGPAISPLPRPATAVDTQTPEAQPQPQRLRIINQGTIPLYDMVVIFPDERIKFGDVPAGATTGYQTFSRGVYRYAAYNVEVEGQKYKQPVVDWIGEAPMQGEAFTYVVETDPRRWTTEGQVIRLVKVVEDQTP